MVLHKWNGYLNKTKMPSQICWNAVSQLTCCCQGHRNSGCVCKLAEAGTIMTHVHVHTFYTLTTQYYAPTQNCSSHLIIYTQE